MRIAQDRRVWLGGGVLVAVLVLAAGWFLLINPKLSASSALRSQTSDAQLQNMRFSSKNNSLKSQNDNISGLRSDLQDAIDGLPTSSGLPEFTRQISTQAVSTRVGIDSISVGTVMPYSALGAAAGAGAAGPVGSPAGKLYSIPVTISSQGPAKNQFAFLHALQQIGPRRVLINTTTFGPGSNATVASIDGNSSLTTVLTVFADPTTADQQAQLDKLLASDSAN
jgi:hypothetical protein